MNPGSLALFALLAFQSAAPPAFEVASIRPADPGVAGSFFVGMSADGAQVRYTNISLRDCIRGAYRVRDFQIDGPDWLSKSRYDITARIPAGASTDQMPEMLRSLIAERFKLEIRRETREEQVYALLVAPGGPKLKPARARPDSGPTALGPDGKPRGRMVFRVLPDSVDLISPSASLASFADLMSRFTLKPVVDMTGIEGQYEFALTAAPEVTPNLPPPTAAARPSEPAPSMFEAVRQYGLKMERRKAPVEIIVVTHAEKTPTEN